MGSKQNLHWIEMRRAELEVLEIAIRREKLNAYKVERKKKNHILIFNDMVIYTENCK